MFLVDTAFQVGTGVDTGSGVPLKEHQVTGVVIVRRVEEVIEADVVEGRGGGEAGDVTTQIVIALVGP